MADYIQRRIQEIKDRGFRDIFIASPLLLFIGFLICLPSLISTKKPTCSVEEFYVPALDKSVNTTIPSNTIFFDIKLHNNNMVKGVKYAPINLTFYYGATTNFPIGNYVVSGFDQGGYKSIDKRQVVETRGVPWLAARGLVSDGSATSFRVGFSTTVRFKFLGIHFKKREMIVGATVEVDDSGEKVGKNEIKLKSAGRSAVGSLPGQVELGGVVVTDE